MHKALNWIWNFWLEHKRFITVFFLFAFLVMILIHQDMIMRLTLDAELEEPNNLHEIRDVLIKYLERVEKLLDENLVRPVLRNRRQVFGTFC